MQVAAINQLSKVVAKIQVKSLVPRDAAQFDFHFQRPNTYTSTDVDHLRDDLDTFFNNIASKLSGAFATATSSLTYAWYNTPAVNGVYGPPTDVRTSAAWLGGGSGNMPAELCAVLSLRADVTGIAEHGAGGTRPRATRRNRIFLGPLYDGTAAINGTTGTVNISSATRTQLTNAAVTLKTNSNAHGWKWMVFSPTLWQQFEAVTAWCDDAYDIQRRRGPDTTARTVVTLP